MPFYFEYGANPSMVFGGRKRKPFNFYQQQPDEPAQSAIEMLTTNIDVIASEIVKQEVVNKQNRERKARAKNNVLGF